MLLILTDAYLMWGQFPACSAGCEKRTMDIRHLRTLIAIDEQKTFAKAAATLGLTQSAVSQQVRTLETELGVPLFDRSVRPPVLNSDGVALLDAGRRIAKITDAAVDGISGRKIATNLSLGAVRSSLVGRLPRALALLKDNYPEITLRLSSGFTQELAHDVARGRLDAAVISGGHQIPDGLNWFPFMREPLFAIAPSGTAATTVKALLESHPFIHFQHSVPLAQLIDRELARQRINVQPKLEADSMPAVVLLVANGLGVAVVTSDALGETLRGDIVMLPFGDPPVHRTFGIVERMQSPKAPLLAKLRVHLYECAGKHATPVNWR